jgi:hypothetical protein
MPEKANGGAGRESLAASKHLEADDITSKLHDTGE